MDSPVPPRHKEIAEKHSIKLIPFDVTTLSTDMARFHPSTLRWPLMFKYFENKDVRTQYRSANRMFTTISLFKIALWKDVFGWLMFETPFSRKYEPEENDMCCNFPLKCVFVFKDPFQMLGENDAGFNVFTGLQPR